MFPKYLMPKMWNPWVRHVFYTPPPSPGSIYSVVTFTVIRLLQHYLNFPRLSAVQNSIDHMEHVFRVKESIFFAVSQSYHVLGDQENFRFRR